MFKGISPMKSTLRQQETGQYNTAMRSEMLKVESWNMQRLDPKWGNFLQKKRSANGLK